MHWTSSLLAWAKYSVSCIHLTVSIFAQHLCLPAETVPTECSLCPGHQTHQNQNPTLKCNQSLRSHRHTSSYSLIAHGAWGGWGQPPNGGQADDGVTPCQIQASLEVTSGSKIRLVASRNPEANLWVFKRVKMGENM